MIDYSEMKLELQHFHMTAATCGHAESKEGEILTLLYSTSFTTSV